MLCAYRCLGTEHYISTLLAHTGLAGEADCAAVLTHDNWWVAGLVGAFGQLFQGYTPGMGLMSCAIRHEARA